MAARAVQLDQAGHTVYFACSGYRERSIEREITTDAGKRETKRVYRVQANVKLVKAFWLDLDVGESVPGKPPKYANQRNAIAALGRFLAASQLPRPMIVSSGYGVHVYWALTETMLPGQWGEGAAELRTCAKALDLLTDPMRTCDSASVLRPIGTHNRKRADAPAPVTLLLDAPAVDPKVFIAALQRVNREHGATPKPPRGDADLPVNATTLIVPDGYQASSAKLIANRCNQLKTMRDRGGDIPEPHWYAAIQLIDKTIEGEELAHEWSRPYPGYSHDECQRKLLQVKAFGPTTCATFEERNPDGCKGCPFRGKIASPIQLGVEIKEAPAPTLLQVVGDNRTEEVTLPNPPAPFKRGDEKNPGLYMEVEPGVPVRFYPYDLFPVELAYDEQEKFMTTRVRHHLPQEGWAEFPFRTSLVTSVREFSAAMVDRGVFPENAKVMAIYMDSYLKLLQSRQKSRTLYNSMGWKEDFSKFLLGRHMYLPGGRIEDAGLSKRVSKNAIDGVTKKGELAKWQEAVAYYEQEGLEPHLFGFLAGFGSPLLAFTGFRGCMMTLLGDSNAGKSLTAMMALSIWGDYNKLRLGKSDTLNARIERMNALSSLPVYVDEFTNTEPKEASEFIYMASQGRGREKLFSDSTVRDAAEWSSITMVSSNKSVVSMLTLGKDNVEAEMLRLFEFWVPRFPWFEAQNRAMYDLIKGNYGHAGEVYVRYLVENAQTLTATIRSVEKQIIDLIGFEGRERFWVSTAAVNVTGFLIATKLGLLPFRDPAALLRRLLNWIREAFLSMRVGLSEAKVDYIDALGQFLNEHTPNTLVIEEHEIHKGSKTQVPRRTPTRELVVREDRTNGYTMIDRKWLRQWLTRRQIDYTQMKRQLMEFRVLVLADERKHLGAGFIQSTQVPVWVINTRAPIFAVRMAQQKSQSAYE